MSTQMRMYFVSFPFESSIYLNGKRGSKIVLSSVLSYKHSIIVGIRLWYGNIFQ